MSFNYKQFYSDIQKTLIIRQRLYLRSVLAPLFDSWSQQFRSGSHTSEKSALPDILGLTIHKEEQIIDGLAKVDSDTANDIMKDYYEKIIKITQSKGGTLQDAEDAFQDNLIDLIILAQQGLLQDAMVKTDKKTNQNKKIPFDDYLVTSTLDKWRRNNRNKNKIKTSSINKSHKSTISNSFKSSERFQPLNKALDDISDTCRKLLEEFFYRKNDWITIAKNLGYSNAASAKNQKYKCMKKMRLIMDVNKYMG